MDILDDVSVDEFTLTQPVDGGIRNGGIKNGVIKTVRVVTQKKTRRNTPTKRSRCSDTLDWVEVETGDKYRKLGKNEKGGY